MVAIYIVASIIAVSFFEYAAHRWGLHGNVTRFGKDHIQHHKFFALTFVRWDESVAGYDSYWIRGLFGLIWHLPVTIPLGIWYSWCFAGIFIVTAFIHALFWAWIHNEMHRPATEWLQRRKYFRFVCNFHHGHHAKSRANYAFVFAPVWDWLFGTYKRVKNANFDNPPP
jgi:hypothetical protein